MHETGGTQRRGLNRGCRIAFPFDASLLVFLVIGWLLIFASATLALQRSPQQWLPVKIVPRVSADYSVTQAEMPKLAPVRAEVIQAVRQDALVSTPSATSAALAKATPSSVLSMLFGPTPTPSPSPTFFQVSAGGPYTGTEGSSILFTATATSQPNESVLFRWDLDNDGKYGDATGPSVSKAFEENGEYGIGVQAIDSTGRIATDVTTVIVQNVFPAVNAGGDRSAFEGEQLSFSAVVRDPGPDRFRYYWDFGDDTQISTEESPLHTYVDNGDYRVRLQVEDDDGGVGEASFVVDVNNRPPAVDAGPDKIVNEGESVTFVGSATDPGKLDTLTYEWDLDYSIDMFTPDASGPSVSTKYPDGPALVVVALRVRDQDGGENVDTVNVQIDNLPPVISTVTDSGPIGEGSPVVLSITATDAPSDTLSFDFDWDKNGVFEDPGQSATVSHTWGDEGDYAVGIRVNDGDGGQAVTDTIVSVYNVRPAAFAGPPIVGLEGSTINFSGSATDPGINDILSYVWNFSDGSVITGATVSRVFPDNYVYSATLTARDGDGGIGTDVVTATILNADPVIALEPDFVVNEGSKVDISAAVTDPGTADVVGLAWDLDYDGGNFDEDVKDTPTVTPRYPDGPAKHLVALRARDDDYPFPTLEDSQDGQAIAVTEVTVRNVPPVAEAGGPYSAHPGENVTLSGSAVDVPADMPSLAFAWDLGLNGTSTGPTVVTAWNTLGVYTVTLRVTDKDGGRGSDTAQVNIMNQPPTIDIGGPYIVTEGITLTLTADANDPDNDPLTYTWYLDPDQVFVTAVGSLSYAWPDDGVYTVTVRADDGWGGTATDSTRVTVENAAPVAISGGPYLATVNVPLELTGSGRDVLSDTLTFAWDLDNDGAFETPGQQVTYTWTTTGVFTVVLQVRDEDGGSGTDTTTVDVSALIPIAWPVIFYSLIRRSFRIVRRKLTWDAKNGRSVERQNIDIT